MGIFLNIIIISNQLMSINLKSTLSTLYSPNAQKFNIIYQIMRHRFFTKNWRNQRKIYLKLEKTKIYKIAQLRASILLHWNKSIPYI